MNRAVRLAVGPAYGSVRDDRILPLTRVVGGVIAPVLLVAFVILWVLPDRTTELFAWTITPEMTPIVMGAGYGTGVYFFYRVVTIGSWHRVAVVFPGIAIFTWFMAAATGLHWGNFNHAHISFWAWAVLYVIAPILVPAIWLINRRTSTPAIGSSGPTVPTSIRGIAAVTGGGVTITAIILFFMPGVMIDTWPWDVSPLTVRILLGWFALLGAANLVVAFDARWSAWRILIHSQLIGLTLVLIGAIRAWSNFESGSVYTWALIGGMAVYLLSVLIFYVWMESR